MNETWEVPQPWVDTAHTREYYRAWALEQENDGRTLVVETYIDAYPDGGDADESWIFDYRVIADYRTGEVLHVLQFEDEEPDTAEFRNLVTLERSLDEG